MMKSLCLVLVASVTTLAFAQSSAQAMLVPASAISSGQASASAADLQTIESTLESKMIRDKLHALGLSDAEIQARLSRLTDKQKHQLASQIRAIHPAGDGGDFVVGVLLVVVLVLLILYLAKRI